MLAQSQGRNEQVVNSYNLFIDSAKDVGGGAGKGDSFSLQLGADSIQAQDGAISTTHAPRVVHVHELLHGKYQQLSLSTY